MLNDPWLCFHWMFTESNFLVQSLIRICDNKNGLENGSEKKTRVTIFILSFFSMQMKIRIVWNGNWSRSTRRSPLKVSFWFWKSWSGIFIECERSWKMNREFYLDPHLVVLQKEIFSIDMLWWTCFVILAEFTMIWCRRFFQVWRARLTVKCLSDTWSFWRINIFFKYRRCHTVYRWEDARTTFSFSQIQKYSQYRAN